MDEYNEVENIFDINGQRVGFIQVDKEITISNPITGVLHAHLRTDKGISIIKLVVKE